MRKDNNFGFLVPLKVQNIDSNILDPRNTWQNKDDYDNQAKKLIQMFIDNFVKFQSDVEEKVRESGPISN